MTRNTPTPSSETLETWRERIQAMYETSPRVRMNITLSHAKVVEGAQATIVGVYRHCFCVEETSTGTPQRHTFTYADLLTRRVDVQPCG